MSLALGFRVGKHLECSIVDAWFRLKIYSLFLTELITIASHGRKVESFDADRHVQTPLYTTLALKVGCGRYDYD